MSSMNPARRRAERFDAAVEDSSTVVADARMLELVELVGALRAAPRPVARPEHVSALRAELMLAAETELLASAPVRTPAPRTARSRRERRIAVALGGLAIVGATTSMAVAAQTALPGDALYPLKRAIEDVDTNLTAGDDQKGTQLLDHAASRLSEVRELSRGSIGSSQTRSIESTLSAFSTQATEASDLLLADYADTGSEQAITQLRTFTNTSLVSLGRLETALPDSLRPAVLDAAQVLFAIDQKASELCPECAGRGITDIPAGLVAADADLGAALAPVLPALSGPVVGVPTDEATRDTKTRPSTSASTPVASQPTSSPGPAGVDAGTPLLPQASGKPAGSSSTSGDGGLGAAVGGIVSGLTGGGSTGSNGAPSAPAPTTLGEVVQGTVGTVGGVVGTVIDPLTGLPTTP